MIKSHYYFDCTEYIYQGVSYKLSQLQLAIPVIGNELIPSIVLVITRDRLPCDDVIGRYLMQEFNFDFSKNDGRRVVV